MMAVERRPPPVQVVLAHGNVSVRDRLRQTLALLPSVEVVDVVGTAADAVVEAWRRRPAVILLDVSLPGMAAEETVRHIGRAAPRSSVCLVVSSENDPGVAAALDAGARDCLRVDAPAAEVADLLRRLA